MTGICLLLSVVAISTPETAEPSESLLAKADTQYHAGLEARADSKKAQPLFAEAAASYEQLWQRGHHNPALARDMAQAHLLAGELAQAIRAYHLGLQAAPHDKDLRAGLAFAREKVQYPLAGNLAEVCWPREQKRLLDFASADALRGIAAIAYLIGLFMWARAWMVRRAGWWIVGGMLLVAAATCGIWVLAEEQRLTDGGRPVMAVVARNNAPLHSGNNSAFPLRLKDSLPAGVELRVLLERGGWLQVQLADGEVGWVEMDRVVRISSDERKEKDAKSAFTAEIAKKTLLETDWAQIPPGVIVSPPKDEPIKFLNANEIAVGYWTCNLKERTFHVSFVFPNAPRHNFNEVSGVFQVTSEGKWVAKITDTKSGG